MNEKETLKNYLKILQEVDVHEPLKNVFTSKGYRSYVTHNPNEKGKDIIATNDKENLLISVKKGDIDSSKWNRDVHPTVTKLIKTDINHSQVNENLPRRFILVFTGELKPMMADTIAEMNKNQHKLGEPIVEYWDINNLVNEFDEHLMNSSLFMSEDLNEVLLSIKKDTFNTKSFKQYIDDQCLDKEPVILNLILLLILRKSQKVNNQYAFFFFIEYLLMKIWSKNSLESNLKVLDSSLFDAINSNYVNELQTWIQKNKNIVNKKFGLFDDKAKIWSEIVGYPLRTHNFLRRICYLMLNSDNPKTYLNLLVNLLENNLHVLSMPIFEFQFNTVGLGLNTLIHASKLVEAKDWYKNIVRNLIFHFHEGYGILPLEKSICETGDFVLKKNKVGLTSTIFILLEFSYILDDEESYKIIINWINNNFSNRIVKETLLPIEKNEFELYTERILNYQELRIDLSGIWDIDKKNYYNMLEKITRQYTMGHKNYILLLIDSVYKDRILQEIWRVPIKERKNKK